MTKLVSCFFLSSEHKSLSRTKQEQQKRPATGDAFEDVLYTSDSELGDSDEDDGEVAAPTGKHKGGDFAARLRLDNDEPMDLLSGAASRITSM